MPEHLIIILNCCVCVFIAGEINVRLLNGHSPSEGRVELYYNGEWGTVCDDKWDLRDATVVCRYLGYSYAISAHALFGAGSGKIVLDEVSCNGNESNLADCSHKGWGVSDCDHETNAGVVCSTALRDAEELSFPSKNKNHKGSIPGWTSYIFVYCTETESKFGQKKGVTIWKVCTERGIIKPSGVTLRGTGARGARGARSSQPKSVPPGSSYSEFCLNRSPFEAAGYKIFKY